MKQIMTIIPRMIPIGFIILLSLLSSINNDGTNGGGGIIMVDAFTLTNTRQGFSTSISTSTTHSSFSRYDNLSSSSSRFIGPISHHNRRTTTITKNNNKSASSTSLKMLLGSDPSFLGIGAPEIAVVALLGYFLLGPTELYKVTKTIGTTISSLQSQWTETSKTFTDGLEEQVQIEELRKASYELNEAFNFRGGSNSGNSGGGFGNGFGGGLANAFAPPQDLDLGLDATPSSEVLDKIQEEAEAVGGGGASTALATATTAVAEAPPKKKRKVRRRKKKVVTPPPVAVNDGDDSNDVVPDFKDSMEKNFGDWRGVSQPSGATTTPAAAANNIYPDLDYLDTTDLDTMPDVSNNNNDNSGGGEWNDDEYAAQIEKQRMERLNAKEGGGWNDNESDDDYVERIRKERLERLEAGMKQQQSPSEEIVIPKTNVVGKTTKTDWFTPKSTPDSQPLQQQVKSSSPDWFTATESDLADEVLSSQMDTTTTDPFLDNNNEQQQQQQQEQTNRFLAQTSGQWNESILTNQESLDPLAKIMERLALLEEERQMAEDRLTEEFRQKKDLDEFYYREKRSVLEEAAGVVQRSVVGGGGDRNDDDGGGMM